MNLWTEWNSSTESWVNLSCQQRALRMNFKGGYGNNCSFRVLTSIDHRLAMSIKSLAAEILETMPDSYRNKCNDLMVAFQRKFGDEHKRELRPTELRCRAQQTNKSLQAFAMEVAHLTRRKSPVDRQL